MEHRLAGEPGMEVPVLVMIGPRRQPTNERQLLAIEESVFLGAKNGAGQIGGCEIVFGSRVGSERSTLYTCRDASLDVDDARPLEKQANCRGTSRPPTRQMDGSIRLWRLPA